ncbi:ATP-binding cassette domain-containing protein [Paenibacillus larvae]|uniref:hypothetical protein n=1 Tax=Paenibacillus larvae TaxID=1464 RepID=UPI00293C2F2E|nr:hypothetical protein [Paenibacillus larvae]MDV3432744.1 hypothetical protein [Paenibacillus larvae]
MSWRYNIPLFIIIPSEGDKTLFRKISFHPGNYKTFLSSYEQSKLQIQAAYERQKREIGRLESFIQKKSEPQGQTSKKPSGPKPRFMFHVHANPVHRIIEATNLIVGYFEPLFGPIDLLVKRGEKIAVVGHNGIESILREKRRPRIIAVIQGLRFDYTVLRFIRNIFC